MTKDKLKRGKWHNGQLTQPELPGVYERKFSFGISFSKWTGTRWLVADKDVYQAGIVNNISLNVSVLQNQPWRGLKDQPTYTVESNAAAAIATMQSFNKYQVAA